MFIPDIASSLDENNLRSDLEQLRDGFSQLNAVSNTIEDIVGFKDVKDYSEFIEIYSDVSWDSIYQTQQDIKETSLIFYLASEKEKFLDHKGWQYIQNFKND